MQVIATAGHVDHGKSTLVRALTGMEPDRWAEERRRGLTIDLGFCWLTLPSGERLALVDVPGHERFVPNMLAGVGPVPAVLFTVAADEGWMPQSEEHLAAVHALGISRGLLAVTRADLADPAGAMRQARERIAATSLGQVEAVAVSAVSGAGLPELLAALDRLAGRLPAADRDAPVRLWVDRAFSIKGSGTVVTGTLAAGTIRERQELLLTPALAPVRVRGIESLKERASAVTGVARVAVNLRGDGRVALARGMALIEPGRWALATVADVRLAAAGARPPRELTVHIGAARTVARVRPLGRGIARLTLREALPLHVGDRLLLRDPGAATGPASGPAAAWPPLAGATVLDLAPPGLGRRGAAAAAAAELAGWPPVPGAAELIHRHRLIQAGTLRAMGVTALPAPVAGDWLADPGYWAGLRDRLAGEVRAHLTAVPLSAGLPVEAARARLGLPARALVEALAGPALITRGGSLRPAGQPDPPLPERVHAAVATLRGDLARQPFAAPEAGRLRELGLDTRAVAAAARAGLLLRITDQVVLAPGADEEATRILAQLPQPFTTAQARQVLGTTRRVAIPLLEYLDRRGATRRLPDDRRELTQRSQTPGS
jgi:selenocysteine-specific elongation factor